MKNIRRLQVQVTGAGEKMTFKHCLMLLAMVLGLNSCSSIFIARFDPVSLQNVTALKKLSLELLDKGTEPYEQHRGEIEGLLIKLEKAKQHSLSIRKNKISVQEWEILISLMKRIFNHWQTSKQLSPVFIREAKKDVYGSFDEVIKLEKGKPVGWGSGDKGVWQGAGCREQGDLCTLRHAPCTVRCDQSRSNLSLFKLSIVNYQLSIVNDKSPCHGEEENDVIY